jgi:hypothetical protein
VAVPESIRKYRTCLGDTRLFKGYFVVHLLKRRDGCRRLQQLSNVACLPGIIVLSCAGRAEAMATSAGWPWMRERCNLPASASTSARHEARIPTLPKSQPAARLVDALFECLRALVLRFIGCRRLSSQSCGAGSRLPAQGCHGLSLEKHGRAERWGCGRVERPAPGRQTGFDG